MVIEFIDVLNKCVIFKKFSPQEINNLLHNVNYKITFYPKDSIIAAESDECSNLGLILSGSVEVKKLFASGKTVTIAKFLPGDIFGEVIIFSETHKYPSTIVSSDDCKILYITKEAILQLCTINSIILSNFMGLLSNKILMLNKKLKNFSYNTIREKVASFLLDIYYVRKKLIFQIDFSRKEMAESLGIPRPSLSRELINMKNEKIIDFHKNTFKILDLNKLEDTILN
ncbi:cAMP-binding domain of CRP or a regulatory subunit of cAMP-dependent protein kinases [Clostridium acidisoli DSM 12555]|uniref:cAMP-binding domain of CRP or a regulatory subunit of cAMP-dependent protein kinases n=1 Tax=Clostridium acidisoli DSM 12555 TaxID=1121291 RepID=A0A1W1XNW1_9CLOT|nr:Crp/Fnr family transcriptional regulator [Clostridium acidisoli]SMC25653.1 cAMP-binding domain of CRP or a regulatory subunit of cAMP-dependent protein kinases [Clostridium acidisoli DSM 12555]